MRVLWAVPPLAMHDPVPVALATPSTLDWTVTMPSDIWALCSTCDRWFYCERWHEVHDSACPVCGAPASTLRDRVTGRPPLELDAAVPAASSRCPNYYLG